MQRVHPGASFVPAAVLILLASCTPQPTREVPAEFQAGQKYFHRVCSNCHGADALGKQTKAPGLIDAEFLPDTFSDDDFREQILEGSDKMPSQRNKVTAAEVDQIIKYLRYSQEAANLVAEDEDREEEPLDEEEDTSPG